ncbi:TonB C-terminal domain-containing protein [Ottowia testudinis]|uniref:TonB C-terminal domain-containing protein n=1 Tax=Ottowia testudinis TaxID=2816950 RepID=A0A975CDM5_9BURK|nr:TonB C-terminal domain-containing protein [Ottowia testudinis]
MERVQRTFTANMVGPSNEVVAPESYAVVEVVVSEDGVVQSHELLEAKGSPAWAAAAVRAVLKTGRVPLQADGTVPSRIFIVTFRP